jgi:plasmid stabilization system protein ParE
VSWRLRVSRRAGRQIRAAATWWLGNRDKAPFAFAEDLEDALGLIADMPRVGQPIPHPALPGVRRLLLARTQHHLYYAIDETSRTVEILALWHSGRGAEPELR